MNWVDYCPTILDWCGVPYPEGAPPLAGRSLLPILDDDSSAPGDGDWEEPYFSHCFHEVTNYYPYRVLRGRRYKYVRNLAHQLADPKLAEMLTEMRQKVIDFRRRTKDPWLEQSFQEGEIERI